MSMRSITLKCGSLKSFFMAAFFTSGAIPRAIKPVKSDSGVSCCTSTKEGIGLSTASFDAAAGCADFAMGALGACTALRGEVAALARSSTVGACVGSCVARPSRTSVLRRDQRLKNPAGASSLAMTTPVVCATTTNFFGTYRGGIAKAIVQRPETIWALAALGLDHPMFIGEFAHPCHHL